MTATPTGLTWQFKQEDKKQIQNGRWMTHAWMKALIDIWGEQNVQQHWTMLDEIRTFTKRQLTNGGNSATTRRGNRVE